MCESCSRLASYWLDFALFERENKAEEAIRMHDLWSELLESAKTCEMCLLVERESVQWSDDSPWVHRPKEPGVWLYTLSHRHRGQYMYMSCADEQRWAGWALGIDPGQCLP